MGNNNKFFRINIKQEIMLAHLVEAAQSQVTHGIEAFNAKFHHHHHHEEVTDVVPSNSIAITQIAGQANFVLTPTGTFADPDPIKTANTEKFNVSGIWNVDGSVMDSVYFYCKLQGVKVFEQTFPCSTGDANCPLPAGTVGEAWKGMFTFDVPGFAPPFEYDVHVVAKDANGTALWD